MNNLFISQNVVKAEINNVTLSYIGPYANDYSGNMKNSQDDVTEIVFHVEFEKEFSYSIDPSMAPLFTIQFTLGYYKSGEYVQTTYTKDVYNLYGNKIENFVGSEATNNDHFFLIDLGVPYTEVNDFGITNPKITSITDNSYIYKVKSGTSKFVNILYGVSYTSQGDFTLYNPTIQANLLYGPTRVFQSTEATVTSSTNYYGSNAILRSSIHDEYNDPINTSYYLGWSRATVINTRYVNCDMDLTILNSNNNAIEANTYSTNMPIYPNSSPGGGVETETGCDLTLSDVNEVCWISMSGHLWNEV